VNPRLLFWWGGSVHASASAAPLYDASGHLRSACCAAMRSSNPSGYFRRAWPTEWRHVSSAAICTVFRR